MAEQVGAPFSPRLRHDELTAVERQPTYTLLLVALAGALSGLFGAACYSSAWRSIAHTVGIWLILVFVVAVGRPVRRAISHTAVALVTAIVAFYVSIASLQPYGLDAANLVLWSVAALVAAGPLGLLASHCVRPDFVGAVTTSLFLGLLLGDAAVRLRNYGADAAVLLDVAGAVTIAVFALRRTDKALTVLALLPASIVLGYAAVSIPNAIEQLYVDQFGIY